MRAFILILTALLVSGPVAAGAWLQDKGDVFLSFGGNIALTNAAVRPVHNDPTLFLEYGLYDALTVGVDVFTADATEVQVGFGFIEFPLDYGLENIAIAGSLALGARNSPEFGIEPLGRVGLHFGKGLDRGWLALDVTGTRALDSDITEAKADAIWGRKFNDRWTGIGTLQWGLGRSGDPYAKVFGSAVRHLSDTRDLQVGLVQGLTGDEGLGLNVGLWMRF